MLVENKRLIWADALRGVLIILVVLGHSLQFGDFENRLSWNIIYSIHMAAFFVVSGYVGYKESYKYSSLKQKAQQLLLPFVSWTLLSLFINGFSWARLYNVLLKPDTSYWFIYVLFLIITLFVVIQNIFPKKCCKSVEHKDIALLVAIIGLIVVMVVTEFRLMGFQFFSLYFGFYVLGYWLRKFKIHLTIGQVVILGIVWLILACFWRMHEVPSLLKSATFVPPLLLIYSYRYITALIGSLFFIGFAMKFMDKNNVLLNLLCYLGKNTLGIYVIHLFIAHPIILVFEHMFQSNESITFVLCDSVSRILISILFINIIQRVPFVRLFLLGKK